MATKLDEDLFRRLRASGLRKKVARVIAEGTDGRRKPAKEVRGVLDDLKSLVDEVEDRATGGHAQRSTAARKAAATRRRQAQARSTAAKKAARTRARSG
jgi:septal ring factor EnvC (AmiA/AmiB activator)